MTTTVDHLLFSHAIVGAKSSDLTKGNTDKDKQATDLPADGWMASATGETMPVTNPYDDSVISHVPMLDSEQVRHAIETAEAVQSHWARLTAQQRATHLLAWADLIDAHREPLAQLLTKEQGKPIKEARGEIDYANSFIRWFAAEGQRLYGDVIPAPDANQRITVLKQPVGVCAAITPWNFPAAMITRKVAPALAAGCTMIVKPAMQTPLTALALGALAMQAGIPKGVLQIVTGDAKTVGAVLCEDVRVRKLSFTGSTEVGRTLMAQCAPTLKKLSLELGGNAPFIVFADADLDKSVAGFMTAKFRNAGQTCICANRLYVQQDILPAFTERLLARLQSLTIGNGLDEATDIAALISADAVDKVHALVQDAIDHGATLRLGGQRHPQIANAYLPTLLTDVTHEMDIAQTEIFGPVVTLFSFSDEDEVIRLANDSPYGLAAYFYTQDVARSWRVAEALEYGMVGHNTGAISNAVSPFGGVKQSGFGREGSKYGIDEYVTMKYWCSDID